MENKCKKCNTKIDFGLADIQDWRLFALANAKQKVIFYKGEKLVEEIKKIGGKCDWCGKNLREIMVDRLN